MRCGCHSCISVINQTIWSPAKHASLLCQRDQKKNTAVSNAANTFNVLLKYSFHPTRRYSVQLPARWSLLKMDRGLSHASCIRSELKENVVWRKKKKKKKLSRMHSHSHTTFFFFSLSWWRRYRGPRLWLMCCGTSCLQLTQGLQRVLTVFTLDILRRADLIRIDASLGTARRAPHRSVTTVKKWGLQLDAHFTTRQWPVTSC